MKSQQRGVTLLELMIGIGIVGILSAIAVPSFRDYTRNTRVTTAQNDLVTAITLARSEALRRSSNVSVCPSANGTSCTGDADWGAGFLVFTDATGTAGVLDGADAALQVWPGFPPDVELAENADAEFLRYTPTGMLDGASRTFGVQSSYCSGDRARRVVVSVVGFPTASKVACS